MRHLTHAAALLLWAGTASAQSGGPSAAAVHWGAGNLGLGVAPAVGTPQGAACAPGSAAPACRPPASAPRAPAAAPVRQPGWVAGTAHGTDNRHLPPPPPNPAQQRALQQAAMGDQFGGRIIPPQILKILGDRRVEPITAYLLWQAARKPIEEWTMRQLQDLTSTLPTLVETGMKLADIQELYKFLELDPGDVFNPQLGQDWQTRSTRFDATSTAAVAEISAAECQTDPGQMTVATYRSCVAGGQ